MLFRGKPAPVARGESLTHAQTMLVGELSELGRFAPNLCLIAQTETDECAKVAQICRRMNIDAG